MVPNELAAVAEPTNAIKTAVAKMDFFIFQNSDRLYLKRGKNVVYSLGDTDKEMIPPPPLKPNGYQ